MKMSFTLKLHDEGSRWAGGSGGEGGKSVPREMMTRSWMISSLASTAETRTEERHCPWILSWHSPVTAQSLPQAEEASLFPSPQRTNSGARNLILFIYFGFNSCRPLTTRLFTSLLWFVWRYILLSSVWKSTWVLPLLPCSFLMRLALSVHTSYA